MEARKSNTRLLSLAASLARKSGAVMAAEAAIEMVRCALSADAGGATVSDADLTAALELADRNGMNPLAGDIRLYPSRDGLSLNPSVTIDGWIRVINAHPQIDGVEFGASNDRVMVAGRMAHEWVECSIHRKDRRYPTKVREYLDDCIDHADPAWQMPNRMLRHRALVQCARIALGLSCGLDDAGKTAAPAVHEATAEPVQMVHIDAGNAVQTTSADSVAGAPDQVAGRPRRATRKASTGATPVEGVVLEAQESLLAPDQPPAPSPTRSDGTPPASATTVKRLNAKVSATFDAHGRAELLVLAGVTDIAEGMTEGDVSRINAAYERLLSGGN